MKIFKIESRRLAAWLAIVFVAAGLVSGAALLISGLPGAIRDGEPWPEPKLRPGKDLSFDYSEEFPSDGIESVLIDLSFETAELYPVDGNLFILRYEGAARNIDDVSEVFTAGISGTELKAISSWKNVSSLGVPVHLQLGVPAAFDGDLALSSGAGRLDIADLSVAALDANLGSGNINVSELQGDVVSLRSGSGSVNIDDSRVGSLTLRALSGSLRAESIGATEITAKVSSGRAVLRDISGSLVLESGSGSADVRFTDPGQIIDIDVSSGGISLALPESTDFELDARTGSGTIKSDFAVAVSGSLSQRRLEGSVGNGGGRTVRLRAGSGSIKLESLD